MIVINYSNYYNNKNHKYGDNDQKKHFTSDNIPQH